jgi:hypothetical protein
MRSGALRPAWGTPITLGQVRFEEYLETLQGAGRLASKREVR